jgi:tetratricopeptide (TPR) repeat protein
MDRSEPQLALYAYLAAIDKSTTFDVQRALKSARILVDYGFPEKAEELIAAIQSKAGDKISPADRTRLLLTEVRAAQAAGQTDRVGNLLDKLVEINPADGEVLLELARHKDKLARDEEDEEKRKEWVVEARTHYQLAVRSEAVAYPANLAYGQMLVREQRYTEALPVLQAALALKKSDSLEQYVSRVRRAADRQEDKKAKP